MTTWSPSAAEGMVGKVQPVELGIIHKTPKLTKVTFNEALKLLPRAYWKSRIDTFVIDVKAGLGSEC